MCICVQNLFVSIFLSELLPYHCTLAIELKDRMIVEVSIKLWFSFVLKWSTLIQNEISVKTFACQWKNVCPSGVNMSLETAAAAVHDDRLEISSNIAPVTCMSLQCARIHTSFVQKWYSIIVGCFASRLLCGALVNLVCITIPTLHTRTTLFLLLISLDFTLYSFWTQY